MSDTSTRPLEDALEAVLLFHSGGIWDDAKCKRWYRLVGQDDVTTQILCDSIRVALGNFRAAKKGEGK